jgi:hypothetical protein
MFTYIPIYIYIYIYALQIITGRQLVRNNQVEEDEMAGSCNTNGGEEERL